MHIAPQKNIWLLGTVKNENEWGYIWAAVNRLGWANQVLTLCGKPCFDALLWSYWKDLPFQNSSQDLCISCCVVFDWIEQVCATEFLPCKYKCLVIYGFKLLRYFITALATGSFGLNGCRGLLKVISSLLRLNNIKHVNMTHQLKSEEIETYKLNYMYN